MAAVCLFWSLAVAGPAAAGRSEADRARIDKCVADRALEQLDPAALRKYCRCMQGIVEDNAPFTVSELERAYPPAHVMCKGKAGLRSGPPGG